VAESPWLKRISTGTPAVSSSSLKRASSWIQRGSSLVGSTMPTCRSRSRSGRSGATCPASGRLQAQRNLQELSLDIAISLSGMARSGRSPTVPAHHARAGLRPCPLTTLGSVSDRALTTLGPVSDRARSPRSGRSPTVPSPRSGRSPTVPSPRSGRSPTVPSPRSGRSPTVPAVFSKGRAPSA
jgi:hypothetical protein